MRYLTIENVAVLFGIISVYLSVRQNIWSWPTAIVNVSLYTIVFHGAKLYADMGLQVVYLVLSFYGWYEWLYGGRNRTVLRVSRITKRSAVTLGALAVAFALLLDSQLAQHTDAALPWVDATLTTVSLVAQYLMTRKVLENWAVWIAVDIAYIPMYLYKHLPPTAALYAIFLILAARGHVEWRRALQAEGTAEAKAAA